MARRAISADGFLQRFGVETTFYHPEIDEAGIAALMRPNTAVVYTESPGSHTFEVQDVPAIARAAHARGAKVLMDNTWGIHHFQPFTHGVDVSIQAATKYPAGHSDILIGSITVNTDADWRTLHATLRGIGPVRQSGRLLADAARHAHDGGAAGGADGMPASRWRTGCASARRLSRCCIRHCLARQAMTLWRRDFTGACSLFGVEFKPDYSEESTHAFVEALDLFGIGASWGGFESLALPTTGSITRTAGSGKFAGPVVRLHIGLEDVADLIADLEQGLKVMREYGR